MAVNDKKKTSRKAIVESLLQCPLSKYFLKSDQVIKFKSDVAINESSCHPEKNVDIERSNQEICSPALNTVTGEDQCCKKKIIQKCKPEVATTPVKNETSSPSRQHINSSLVHKVASPESIKAKEALFSGKPILTKAIVVPLKSCLNGSVKTPYVVRDLPFSYYEKHFDLRECSVKIKRLQEKENQMAKPIIKDCIISVNDIKTHSWWGPKVTQLCGGETTLKVSALNFMWLSYFNSSTFLF
jgi:hypothetical protein